MPKRESHGMTNTPEYRAWTDMRTRCRNKRSTGYHNYGGRGISICGRWESFSNFLADMGPKPSRRHSLERLSVNGNYEPNNCCWATATEQARNKRTSVRLPTGEHAKEAAPSAGLSYAGMRWRVKRGKPQNISKPNKASGWVEFSGITDTYEGWSRRTGIKPSTIAMRLSRGWPIEQALAKRISNAHS